MTFIIFCYIKKWCFFGGGNFNGFQRVKRLICATPFLRLKDPYNPTQGCLKYILRISLPPANKNFCTISFILYLVLTC